MRRWLALTGVALILAPSGWIFAGEADEAARKRTRIDEMARQTMELLFDEAPRAKRLFDDAYGYAVFSNLKFALVFSGGGGSGVAVERETGERTYMRMGTVGIGLGVGGKKYQVVFLFENEEAFDRFVDKGWQADASASATAGTSGAGVASTFTEGLAIFQFSKNGLMAQADVAGTKYWKADKLN